MFCAAFIGLVWANVNTGEGNRLKLSFMCCNALAELLSFDRSGCPECQSVFDHLQSQPNRARMWIRLIIDIDMIKCHQVLSSSPPIFFSFPYNLPSTPSPIHHPAEWKRTLPDATSCYICALFTLVCLFLPEIHFYLIISVYVRGFTDSLLQPVQTKTNKIFNLRLKWNSIVGVSRAILKCIIRRKTNIPVLTINSKAFMYISWVQKTF